MTLSSFVSFAVAFACNLGALSPDERVRHTRSTGRLHAAVLETQELESGYRFRVSEPGMDLPALAEWVRLERRCCPFFTFAIEVEGDGGATWLALAGAAGAKEFIRAELGLR